MNMSRNNFMVADQVLLFVKIGATLQQFFCLLLRDVTLGNVVSNLSHNVERILGDKLQEVFPSAVVPLRNLLRL